MGKIWFCCVNGFATKTKASTLSQEEAEEAGEERSRAIFGSVHWSRRNARALKRYIKVTVTIIPKITYWA